MKKKLTFNGIIRFDADFPHSISGSECQSFDANFGYEQIERLIRTVKADTCYFFEANVCGNEDGFV